MKEKVPLLQKAFNVWAVILIFWSFYRVNFRTDLPIWFDELIIKPLFFIAPVFWFIHTIEKKEFFNRIDLHFRKLKSDIVLGAAIGTLFLVMGYIGYSLRSSAFSFSVFFNTGVLAMFPIALVTAISEEILSRGFILKRLYEDSKNPTKAIIIASILFFFIHIPILFTALKVTGYMLLSVMIMDFLLSITVSVLYLQRKSLLLPIIVHALYSFSFSFFL
ncbi:MAG: type II CAAX endopeptidase family protein [Patescibacteria group bacterium]